MKDLLEDIVKNLTRLKARVDSLPRYELSKNNFAATAAPAVGDDGDDGYSVGSVWINVTADDAYICCDSTVGAAVWKKTTP